MSRQNIKALKEIIETIMTILTLNGMYCLHCIRSIHSIIATNRLTEILPYHSSRFGVPKRPSNPLSFSCSWTSTDRLPVKLLFQPNQRQRPSVLRGWDRLRPSSGRDLAFVFHRDGILSTPTLEINTRVQSK